MIEFGKIFCDLHPNELVTNYCCRGNLSLMQKSATWDYVLLAFAVTPNPIYKEALLPTIRTSELPTPTCMIP